MKYANICLYKRYLIMKKILILEDIPDVKDWLSDLVKEHLIADEIHCAETLAEAFELLKAHQYSLAILDIGLPDGSGLDALKLIKSQNESCLCVVSSIFDASEYVFTALKYGADGYILKSESSEQVAEHLKGILLGKPPLSPSIAKKILLAFRPEKDIEVHLSPREEQILGLMAKGYNIPDAAKLLDISQHTAAGYLKQVYKKLQVNNRADATLKAYELGLVNSAKKISVNN